ncbi:MAG: translation initiation factor IF-3, partial [Ferrovum sp.]|nr:translation initiation factor IF-3 [Ferrovum sp.]
MAIAQDKEVRINGEITVAEVRLVGIDGEQLGIMRLNDALRQAEEA